MSVKCAARTDTGRRSHRYGRPHGGTVRPGNGFVLREEPTIRARVRLASTDKDNMPKENDLEGPQDQGGKHGGQAGMPKSQRQPSKQGEHDPPHGKVVGDPKPTKSS
jgi:hypothetical protein